MPEGGAVVPKPHPTLRNCNWPSLWFLPEHEDIGHLVQSIPFVELQLPETTGSWLDKQIHQWFNGSLSESLKACFFCEFHHCHVVPHKTLTHVKLVKKFLSLTITLKSCVILVNVLVRYQWWHNCYMFWSNLFSTMIRSLLRGDLSCCGRSNKI